MKIIRPVDLAGAGVVESNAPQEEFAQWEAVGPEYAEDLSGPVVSASDDYVYVMDQSDGSYDIRQHDPATGQTAPVSLNWQDAGLGRAIYLAVSPDDSRIAVVFEVSADSFRLDLYDSGTGVRNYSAPLRWQRWSRVLFSRDSSRLITKTMRDNAGTLQERITFVDTSTYTESHSDWVSNAPQSGEKENSATGMAYDNSSGVAYAWFNRLTTTGGAIGSGRLLRFDGSSTAQFNHGVGNSGGFPILFDEPGGQLGTMFGLNEIVWRDSVTMAQISAQPLPTSFRAFEESQDGAFVYFVFVLSPCIREFDLALRQVTSSTSTIVPNLYPSFGSLQYRSISMASGFIGFRKLSGFSVIDASTMTEITQANPSVTTGDIYTYGERNYEALTDNNDRPDLGAIADPPTWLDLGAINPLRMFDNKLDSRTTAPSPLVIDVTPGMLVNGLALFNVDAATVQITYTDPNDGLVYDTGQISMLDNSGVQDWYSFFFDPYLVKSDLARVDLPAYIDGTIQITLDGAGADVAIGEVVLGTIYQIGDAQYGSSAGILDFSRKETDQFGNFEIVPRRFSKRAEFDTVIPPAYGGSVQRTLARLRATPVVWVGSVDLEETIVYGYFREFDILLSNPAFSNVTITVEGL